MKVSDYIVQYLIDRGVTDVFGYPGGMVTHLMDSLYKYNDKISTHTTYHEQAAAFAACGYAQASGNIGVAYATSGPGATNLITGICNAYFDSIPVLFITGQVNTTESRFNLKVRQRGFQETDIVAMVKNVTKYAVYVDCAEKIQFYLDTAFREAKEGRAGPVLLDIPMNIFRAEIDEKQLVIEKTPESSSEDLSKWVAIISENLDKAKHPCIIVGNAVKQYLLGSNIEKISQKFSIPIVTSMIAFDAVGDCPNNYGFIGAYGDRCANFIVAKSDLIIACGTRLDVRQVGGIRANFAPDATIVRFDVDSDELNYQVRDNEIDICMDIKEAIAVLESVESEVDFEPWLKTCNQIKDMLSTVDRSSIKDIIETISENISQNAIITADVGQNQVWLAQYFKLKNGQRFLFSGGHGAMGYSLPAAIGAYYATNGEVVCFCGDGGIQMNIQELQFIVREHIPIKIIVLNNNALGMIRHFQEMYFEGRYFQTKPEWGYSAPNFADIGRAYGIESLRIKYDSLAQIIGKLKAEDSIMIEVLIDKDTYVFPKLEFGKPNQDQEPLLGRKLYNEIMALDCRVNKDQRGGGNAPSTNTSIYKIIEMGDVA